MPANQTFHPLSRHAAEASASIHSMPRDRSTLLLELDDSYHERLSELVGSHGILMTRCVTIDDVLRHIQADCPDLVILGRGLRRGGLFDCCRQIRQADSAVPIMCLIDSPDELDELIILELGADNCVSHDKDPRLVAAHVRAQLRRQSRPQTLTTAGVARIGRLTLNRATCQVEVNGQCCTLSAGKLCMLELLMSRPDQMVSRIELNALHPGGGARQADSQISRLRKVLVELGLPSAIIRPVRGLGYALSSASCA